MFRIDLRPLICASTNCSRVCAFAFGNSASACVERLRVRVGHVTAHLHEREEVLRRLVVRVERRARERDAAERRAAGRRLEDSLDDEVEPACRWGVSTESASRRAGGGRPRSPSSTKAPSSPRLRSTACDPSSHSSVKMLPTPGSTAVTDSVVPKMRASPARTLAIASTPGVFAAAFAGTDRDRREVVLRGDRVVRREDVVDRALERRR